MHQTPTQRANLIAKIQSRIDKGLVNAERVVKENAPVDTSSFRESVRHEKAHIEGTKIIGSLLAGGLDYTGQIMPATGKEGRNVDYALEVEIRTGCFSSGIPWMYYI